MPRSNRPNNEDTRRILAEIEDQHGELTPEIVISEARSKKHPLHGCFTWDDKRAADLRRLDEARELIRSVKVIVSIEHRTVMAPAYVHNPKGPAGKPGYLATVKVKEDVDLRRELLLREFSAAGGHLRRARELAIYLECTDQIDELLEKFEATFRGINPDAGHA